MTRPFEDRPRGAARSGVGHAASQPSLSADESSQASLSALFQRHGLPTFAGRYEIDDVCEGGMAYVLLCHDRDSAAPLAVKIAKQTATSTTELLAEAKTWISLGFHPNIVEAFYVGLDNKRLFIVLERVPKDPHGAVSLRDHLRHGNVPLSAMVTWSFEICRGMDYAFGELNVVHRDLKPENVLITPEGHAKVTDFGLASSLLTAGVSGGTPAYMAPEQRFGKADSRSDVYAIGLIMFEMLAGNLPDLEHASPDALFAQLPSDRGQPTIARQLCMIISKCLQPDRAHRWQDVSQLLGAVTPVLKSTYPELYARARMKTRPAAHNLTNRGLALLAMGMRDRALDLLQEGVARSIYDQAAVDGIREALAHIGSYWGQAKRLLRQMSLAALTCWGAARLVLLALLILVAFTLSPVPSQQKLVAAVIGALFLWEALFNMFTLCIDTRYMWFVCAVSSAAAVLYWSDTPLVVTRVIAFTCAGLFCGLSLFAIRAFFSWVFRRESVGLGTCEMFLATFPLQGGRLVFVFLLFNFYALFLWGAATVADTLRMIVLRRRRCYVARHALPMRYVPTSMPMCLAHVTVLLYGQELASMFRVTPDAVARTPWLQHLDDLYRAVFWWTMGYGPG